MNVPNDGLVISTDARFLDACALGYRDICISSLA